MTDLIRDCLVLSNAVYSGTVPADMGIVAYERIVEPKTDTSAIAYIRTNDIIIAVQGSQSLVDWHNNTKIRKTDFHGIRAHRGFAAAAESILVRVMRIIAAHSDKHVVLTGHSLGGAIATLLAVALRPKQLSVITAGQPKVATEQELRLAMYGEYIRVVNGSDLVPRVPRFGFAHAGTCVYLSNQGKKILDPSMFTMLWDRTLTLWQSQRASDHFSRDYIEEYDRCEQS